MIEIAETHWLTRTSSHKLNATIMTQIELKERLRYSAKRALLGNANQSIRAIGVMTDGIKLIVKCYVDHAPTEVDFDSLNDISGEMLADFYYNELETSCEFSTKSIFELQQIGDMIIVVVESSTNTN